MFYGYLEKPLGFFTYHEAQWLLAERQAWASAMVIAVLSALAWTTAGPSRPSAKDLWHLPHALVEGVVFALASWAPGFTLVSRDIPVTWQVSNVPPFVVFAFLATASLACCALLFPSLRRVASDFCRPGSARVVPRPTQIGLIAALILLVVLAVILHAGVHSAHEAVIRGYR